MKRKISPINQSILKKHSSPKNNIVLRPHQEALSDKGIEEIWWNTFPARERFSLSSSIFKFARAIEAAHGISYGYKD
jgi:hypothetical protein